MKQILISGLVALILTSISYLVGFQMNWITELNWLEVFAVFTSYSCTYLCVHQVRFNYIVGIVTTAAYSILFYQWAMPALALFNLYLVFSLIYGWFRWGPDGNTLPVTWLPHKRYPLYALFGLFVLGLFLFINGWLNPGGVLNPIDVGLAVASGVAQLLLDNKRINNWFVWAGINIVSIPFFFMNGLTLVAFQYIFFLANTIYGYIEWKKSMKVEVPEHKDYVIIGEHK